MAPGGTLQAPVRNVKKVKKHWIRIFSTKVELELEISRT